MDNSENMEEENGGSNHEQSISQLFATSKETNIDFPSKTNSNPMPEIHITPHTEIIANGNGSLELNGHTQSEELGSQVVQNGKTLDGNEKMASDEDSKDKDGTFLEEGEIPFSNYEKDDSENDIDGTGDHSAEKNDLSSPTKMPNGFASELRRISSKDIYPDRETEEFETSDDDSSDEEAQDELVTTDVLSKGSPKMRRKQKSDCYSLLWTDEESHASTMHHLDVFRRSKQFCDLILQVGGREIHCHRVVVGGGCRFLYKELVQGEKESTTLRRISLNQIQPQLSPDAVESLVDYMYTSKLIIPQGQLQSVYCASVKLRVERVMPVCRRNITNRLDVGNCVKTWRLAWNVEDLDLLTVLNEYIEENFETITKSNEFLALPRIKMVVIASNLPLDAPPFHVLPRDNALGQLALSWVKGIVKKNGGRYMEELTEQIQRIPLEELTNTVPYSNTSSSSASTSSSPGSNKQVPPSFPVTNDESTTKSSPKQRLSRTSSIDSLSSSGSEKSTGYDQCKPEGQWTIIASMQTADHMIALCNLGDVLSTLTLHLPTNLITNSNFYGMSGNPSNSVSTSSSSSHSCASSVGSVSELSHLSQARCAAGVTALNGKIYAMGGYNQSECLDSVECYDPNHNKWTMVARMQERRARFTAAVLNGQIYAVGGSTGSKDQLSVERYDPESDKWSQAPPLPIRCCGVAVAVMNDKLYCIGGVQQSTGVAGIKLCHQFDPVTQSWQSIASLNTGRSFAGVAELNGILYCVGGTDGWTCLTSVERYNGDKWIRGPQLNVPRRGAGLAKFGDTLYCVGGSDGGSFWSSIEQYAHETDSWTMLPTSMTVPRSNVGLVSLNGLLFAIGGFSGRHFLNSIETMDETGDEWTTHDAHIVAAATCNNIAYDEGGAANS
ncbi:uncharacterized protein LOC120345045 [Styela clava]